MIECYSCGAEFEVEYSDNFEDAEVEFCPACGTRMDEELDFGDDL